jgi:penicillin-binding protein 1B
VTNSEGTQLVEGKPQSRLALRPEVSWLMTSILQDVLNKGTGSRARAMGFASTAAGKTGTSRDGWFAGYTPNLVCVVWVGFDDNSELGLEGSKSALPIWTVFMKQALQLRPDLAGEGFPMPEGIVSVEIDPTTGLLAGETCSNRATEYYIEGTQPEGICEDHSGDSSEPPPSVEFDWPEGKPELAERARRAINEAQREARRQMEKQLR